MVPITTTSQRSTSNRLIRGLICLCLSLGWTASAYAEEDPAIDDDAAGLQAEEAETDEDGAQGLEAGSKDEEEEEGDEEEEVVYSSLGEEEQAREFVLYRDAHTRFALENQDYQRTIDAIIEAEFNRRVAGINASYDRDIRAKELIEREHRLSAIATFEDFVRRHRNEPAYTPDALFRLAELYFEKTNEDYLAADEEFQKQRALYDAGRLADFPDDPIRDYGKSMELFRRLISDWPDYRHIDGAYYLLAYCELQMGNQATARDLLAELIVAAPESRFVTEAWLRIGEYHFDYSDATGMDDITQNLKLAGHAYRQAMREPGSTFYDKALYKLAWTYYRLDDFDQAIALFKELVEFSDEQERLTGRSGAVLREEAVQYIAISLAEEDWNLDGSRDENFGLARVSHYLKGEHDYEREVLLQLSEYLFDRNLFAETIEILEYILEKFPIHRQNPEIHQQIIIALHRDRQPDAAFAVRRRMIEFYGPESDWFAYQTRVGNDEAMRFSDNIVRDNLIEAATWYHEEAQKLRNEALVRRDPDLLALAEQRYGVAAGAYEDFLTRYPNDKEAFQWNFYYAECLYNSAQYGRAFEQYEVVRELDLEENEYQEVSAFNAVKALEFTMRDMVTRGELTSKALAGLNMEDARETAQGQETSRAVDDDRDQQVIIDSEPIPAMVTKYVTAMDRYVVLRLQNEDDRYLDAKLAFQAAKIYYDFKHYDEARRRFAWLVNNYPEHEVAYLGGSLILETYREENNFTMLAEWAERLATVIRGEQAEAVRAEVREFRLGALFKSAEELYAAEKYAEAAEEYIRLVNDAPEHEYAPKALNNAAVAYEVLRRYDSAMRLYERVYQEYTDDPLAGYALYRVAVNSEQFFDYEKAIQSYKLFYDRYRGQSPPELEAMGFIVEDRRLNALKSVAVLQESLQLYEDAAKTYTAFARAYPNDEDADPGMWQAISMWRRAKDDRKMLDAIQAYIREYGQNPDNNERVLEGMLMIADHYEERGDKRTAARWYNTALSEFEKRGLEPASPEAYYAGKARFMLTEHKFEEWKNVKIIGNLKRQERLLKEKVEGQQALTAEYGKVMGFRNLEWTMAANFRIGSLLQSFANSLYDVPIPFPEDSEEFMMYEDALLDIAVPLEEAAIERFVQTIERARQDKIVNEWTKKTLEELSVYRKGEYPLYKEERRAIETRNLTGIPPLDRQAYEQRQERLERNPDDEEVRP